MAKIYTDPKDLPQRHVVIPGAKPPVMKVPHSDSGSPEEADEFVAFIRQLRGKSASTSRKPK